MRQVLVLVAMAALGCAENKDHSTIQSVLAAARPRLDPAVEIRGDNLALRDGQLELAIRVEHDDDRAVIDRKLIHLHALATASHRSAAKLDLCIVGVDAADAARSLVEVALPPVVAAVRGFSSHGAWHTWLEAGGSLHGRSVYVGPLYKRGDVSPEMMTDLRSVALADFPAVPRDGRIHLAKFLLAPEHGVWARTVELDGPNEIETARPLPGELAASSVGVVIGFAVIDDAPDPEHDEAGRVATMQRLATRPAWLPAPETCAAKLMPAKFVESEAWELHGARGGRLTYAVHACELGDRDACDLAAQDLVQQDQTDPVAQSLFLRACQLGSASGCTNAAASRRADDACNLTTYEASCERGHDPWGCAMLGMSLLQGVGGKVDATRARAALTQACAPDKRNPACEAVMEIQQKLAP